MNNSKRNARRIALMTALMYTIGNASLPAITNVGKKDNKTIEHHQNFDISRYFIPTAYASTDTSIDYIVDSYRNPDGSPIFSNDQLEIMYKVLNYNNEPKYNVDYGFTKDEEFNIWGRNIMPLIHLSLSPEYKFVSILPENMILNDKETIEVLDTQFRSRELMELFYNVNVRKDINLKEELENKKKAYLSNVVYKYNNAPYALSKEADALISIMHMVVLNSVFYSYDNVVEYEPVTFYEIININGEVTHLMPINGDPERFEGQYYDAKSYKTIKIHSKDIERFANKNKLTITKLGIRVETEGRYNKALGDIQAKYCNGIEQKLVK